MATSKSTKLKESNQSLKKSYSLSKSLIPPHFVSKHWDIYPKNFSDSLFDNQNLLNFRNNNLSFKCNDTLEKRTDRKVLSVLKNLVEISGLEFIKENKEEEVGNPKTFFYENELYDYHDLFLVYFLHVLIPYIDQSKRQNRRNFIAEIGGGYGGLIYKIKRLYPNTTCILFDLPETNFISNYYLKSLNPNASILNFSKLVQLKGNEPIERLLIRKKDLINYDYVILPGYLIENFTDCFVDIFINTRSFMEMNLQTINFYFSKIHKVISAKGLFYCVNRYKKITSGDIVKYKTFPFDLFWNEVISRRSFFQPMIHEGLFRRQIYENIKLKKNLSRLSPYDVQFFKSLI